MLRFLFPTIPLKELMEIEEVFSVHCAIVQRIHQRLEREQPEVIDEMIRSRRIETKVDSSKQE